MMPRCHHAGCSGTHDDRSSGPSVRRSMLLRSARSAPRVDVGDASGDAPPAARGSAAWERECGSVGGRLHRVDGPGGGCEFTRRPDGGDEARSAARVAPAARERVRRDRPAGDDRPGGPAGAARPGGRADPRLRSGPRLAPGPSAVARVALIVSTSPVEEMKRSAGLLVYRRGSSTVEVLLVHPGGPFWAKRDDGAWSLPKGEHGQDEDPFEVAVREFREEVGSDPPAGRSAVPLGELRQPSGKHVTAWALEGDLDAGTVRSN